MSIRKLLLLVVVNGLLIASSNLFAQTSQSVNLAWDASASPNVAGYVVRYGTASGAYAYSTNVGNQTTARVPGLQAGQTYYFAVTAIDALGVESVPSNEVSYQAPVSTPPVIVLTSPVSGATYTAPASVSLAASVTANGHTITKVQFYNGAILLGEDTTAPYSVTWGNVSAGSYSLTARVIYDAGSTLNSSPINVNVTATSQPPTIALTAPASGASYAAPATITCAASVTANGHNITKVQFYNGAILLGEDTVAPYSVTWGNVSAGSYSLTARVVYDAGSTLNSSPINVNVTATSLPPTIALTSPTSGASYAAPATITCAATVTPNGHTITKVQFFNGPTLLGEDASAPYNYSWNGVSSGSYSLTARAVYNSGSAVDSAPVTITVAALPAPWQVVDIGTTLPGGASYSNGNYTVQSAGQIAGTADSFQFVYQPLSADGEIKARLNSISPDGPNRIVGLMIRESLAPGSKYAFMGVGQDQRFRWQRRSNTSGSASSTTSSTCTPPNAWVRVVRNGNTLTGYMSTDGTSWTKVSNRNISMAPNIHVGLVVASGDFNTVNTSAFTSVIVVP